MQMHASQNTTQRPVNQPSGFGGWQPPPKRSWWDRLREKFDDLITGMSSSFGDGGSWYWRKDQEYRDKYWTSFAKVITGIGITGILAAVGLTALHNGVSWGAPDRPASLIKIESYDRAEQLTTKGPRTESRLFINDNSSNDIYNHTIEYFNDLYKQCLDNRATHDDAILNLISFRAIGSKYYLSYGNIKDGHLACHASRFDTEEEAVAYARNFIPIINEAGGRGIFFQGDDTRGSDMLIDLMDHANLDFVRRGKYITKSYFQAADQISSIQDRVFDPAGITFINSVPITDRHIAAAELSLMHKSDLIGLSDYFNSKLQGSTTINDKATLLEELQHGSRDLLLLIAHADKLEIYLGDERISLEELKAMRGGPERKRPRVAYLFSCNTGNVNQNLGRIPGFKKAVESFSEVLIQNDMVDSIVAPEHEITDRESKDVLDYLLQGQSLKAIRQNINKGWQKIASLDKPISYANQH